MWTKKVATLTATAALLIGATVAVAGSSERGAGHDAKVAAKSDHDGKGSDGGSLASRLRTSSASDASSGAGDAKSAGHGGATAWSYGGKNGPNRWSTLTAGYEACGKGRMQSPVNLQGPAVRGEVDIDFDYKASLLQVLNNGHTFEVVYGAGSGILVNGERFELLQFHFHSPSEHSRDGQRYPMEVHLVHKNAKGQLAVVGIFMESGAENIALMEMWDHMPMQAGPAATVDRVAVSAADLVPSGTQFFRYMGSLTTPPCSEGVNWFVASEAISVSRAQVEKFLQAAGENARPLQALNNRLLAGPMQYN